MEVLVIDVGGTGVKLRTSTSDEVRRFRSGPELTPEMLVEKVTQKTADWRHDVVSIGYPGSVAGGSVIAEPGNLGSGWVGYDFRAAFDRPVRVVNDAILQALGAYRSGRMLFLGLGTGVGSAIVSEHVLIPLELGCLPHPRGGTQTLASRGMVSRREANETARARRGRFQHRRRVNADDRVELGGGGASHLGLAARERDLDLRRQELRSGESIVSVVAQRAPDRHARRVHFALGETQ